MAFSWIGPAIIALVFGLAGLLGGSPIAAAGGFVCFFLAAAVDYLIALHRESQRTNELLAALLAAVQSGEAARKP